MDAEKPNSLIKELQNLSGVESEEFSDFVSEIVASSSMEIKSLDDLRVALAEYVKKQMANVEEKAH